MKSVEMKVNAANLVQGLKFSFTNKTTVLGELMQNARRANATQVVFEFAPETKILRVTDDGCGIDSIETLLTVAESGWDADVVAQEHPFGIGFLSALFACSHITVVSKGGRISVNTNDILSFKPVTVMPVTDWDGHTVITMLGVDLELNFVERKLNELASAFPIPVFLNGIERSRPHAINSGLNFISTEVGSVFLSGLDSSARRNHDIVIYLQGLPIYKSCAASYGGKGDHVIHLDSSRFFGRLPDRDQLVDEDDVLALVNDALKAAIGKRLIEMKSTLPSVVFVDYYYIINAWNLLHLLNDVPVVPCQVLREIDCYPNCDEERFGEFELVPEKPVLQEEILSGRRVVTFDEYMQDEGSALSMYVLEKGFYVYNGYSGGLDEHHWLHAHILDLNSVKVSIELINESHKAEFSGQWAYVNAVFCDGYRIHVGGDFVEVYDNSMFDGAKAIVPKGDGTGSVLTQACSFRDDDDFQQSVYEADEFGFSQFVVANTSSDTSDAMKRLLPSFSGCPSLYGKAFVITLDDSGKVASVTAA